MSKLAKGGILSKKAHHVQVIIDGVPVLDRHYKNVSVNYFDKSCGDEWGDATIILKEWVIEDEHSADQE